MKTTLSIAVLALLGHISSAEVLKRHHHGSFVQNKMKNLASQRKDWWELNNSDERIHGYHQADNASPHDPDVVDAPEDIRRVENDHEALHNAKLSPDGYYNGFYHKDHEGKFAQKSAKKHHKKHHKHHDFLQVDYEHDNDTDDIPDGLDPILAQRGSA